MKAGDIIEWEGVRKTERGIVEESSEHGYIVRMDTGKVFLLKDLRGSKSAKLIENGNE